jgi:transcriptional regulator GlxA family with amidase domain
MAEIIRVRSERARYLLVTTTLSAERVAVISGFGNAQRLCKVFKRQLGIAPCEYRRKHQSLSGQ